MIDCYSAPEKPFADLYLKVRAAENRLLSDQQVLQLPNVDKFDVNASEWKLRKKSAKRFTDYITQKRKPLKILDIGCGNGWFSNKLSEIPNVEILAIDVNLRELEQAARLFNKPNLSFADADLFADAPDEKFDIAVFNSCFQYFENVQKTIEAAKKWLKTGGEIHIIDSPFYRQDRVEAAKLRTKKYYENLGFPEMTSHYFHHSWNELPEIKIYYKPTIFTKLLKNSPFCWISISQNAKVGR